MLAGSLMNPSHDTAVAMTRTRRVLVVTMQPDLDQERFDRLRLAAIGQDSQLKT